MYQAVIPEGPTIPDPNDPVGPPRDPNEPPPIGEPAEPGIPLEDPPGDPDDLPGDAPMIDPPPALANESGKFPAPLFTPPERTHPCRSTST